MSGHDPEDVALKTIHVDASLYRSTCNVAQRGYCYGHSLNSATKVFWISPQHLTPRPRSG